ncbi:helix-turn-helix transcriptional regulator, partial [Ramlibacter aquaticus]
MGPLAEPSPPLAELMRRGDVLSPACPAREILQHVTSRWGVLVLVALQGGTLRFSELRRKVGVVSERMLAQTLQVLERDGFVERRAYPVVPPHVDYRLTPLGREVGLHVQALADWIGGHLPDILA